MTIKNTVKGSLHEAKGTINEQIGKMTGDQLKEFKGDAEKLTGYLQKKHDISYNDALSLANQMLVNYC